MTRIASVLGVATVAMLVLLSGCESATSKKDYVKDLAGTWNASIAAREVVNPLHGMSNALIQLGLGPDAAAALAARETVEASSTLVLTITDGAGQNSGTFKLDMTNTAAPVPGISLPPGLDSITFTLTGDLKADGEKVTISEVVTVSKPIPGLARQEALDLLEGDTEFDYTLAGDSLTISSTDIPVLLQVTPEETSLTFTKSS